MQSLHPRKYRANLNVLFGAVAIGECHLYVVFVELDEMEFGLVDMNVATAIVECVIILRQSNVLFASLMKLLRVFQGVRRRRIRRRNAGSTAAFPSKALYFGRMRWRRKELEAQIFSRIYFSGKE